MKVKKVILPNNEIANGITKIPVSDNLKNELMTHNELVKNQKLEIIIFQY